MEYELPGEFTLVQEEGSTNILCLETSHVPLSCVCDYNIVIQSSDEDEEEENARNEEVRIFGGLELV